MFMLPGVYNSGQSVSKHQFAFGLLFATIYLFLLEFEDSFFII